MAIGTTNKIMASLWQTREPEKPEADRSSQKQRLGLCSRKLSQVPGMCMHHRKKEEGTVWGEEQRCHRHRSPPTIVK